MGLISFTMVLYFRRKRWLSKLNQGACTEAGQIIAAMRKKAHMNESIAL